MHAFTNIYEVPIWVVGHLWRSLHSTVTNVRYSKGCVLYEGERITCSVSPIRSSSPPMVIWSYYTTLLSNHIGPNSKYVAPFALRTRRQMRKMGEGNRFYWSTPSIYLDPPGDRQFVPGNFWGAELLLQS